MGKRRDRAFGNWYGTEVNLQGGPIGNWEEIA